MNFQLVNPPIYDFAAYDLWAKPLGLLYLSAILKESGHKTFILDCMDRKSCGMPETRSDQWGCGSYHSVGAKKPDVLAEIPRKYKRYGMPVLLMREMLADVKGPAAIFVSPGMSCWYPGVLEAVKLLKDIFNDVPSILGGNYATLCFEHASTISGADYALNGGLTGFLQPLGVRIERLKLLFSDYPAPDYEPYGCLEYAVLRTSEGCRYRCDYCAAGARPGKGWVSKSPEKVVAELEGLAKKGIKNVAFYDDGLLFEAEQHIIPVLKEVITRRPQLNFHTPDGLHARFLSEEVAELLYKAGLVMPRISIETVSEERHKETGGKVSTREYLSAVNNLVNSGYRTGQ